MDITISKKDNSSIEKGVENMAIDDGKRHHRSVSLHFENMGSIVAGGPLDEMNNGDSMLRLLKDGRRVIDLGNDVCSSYYEDIDSSANLMSDDDDADKVLFEEKQQQLEQDLSRQLALPSPAREALLSVALLLLSKKDQLQSVSNSAIFPETNDDNKINENRWMLILNWRSLLQTLLRTAPYLDEHKAGSPPMNSNSRTSITLKRTVQLIRRCRKFFDQGIRPPDYQGSYKVPLDDTAIILWENLKTDLLYHSHSNSCFRALILLYLFHPSKSSTSFYRKVMPLWMECWSNINRCPEYDFLWMVLFCRARKYVTKSCFDWGELRRYLLTMAGMWLQIPVGGVSADKSFPRAGRAAKRSFPRNLKVFVGTESKYEEGEMEEWIHYSSFATILYCLDLSHHSIVIDFSRNRLCWKACKVVHALLWANHNLH